MPPRALLVDLDTGRRSLLAAALGAVAHVDAPEDFASAHRCLSTTRYDLLATNIRLAAYNGLHLVYIARLSQTRCVVYAEDEDLFLARLAQAAGAFYEHCGRVAFALPRYPIVELPSSDRRDPAVVDRRSPAIFRGGRRCADLVSVV